MVSCACGAGKLFEWPQHQCHGQESISLGPRQQDHITLDSRQLGGLMIWSRVNNNDEAGTPVPVPGPVREVLAATPSRPGPTPDLPGLM